MTHSSLWPLLAVVPQCNGWFQSPSNHYLNMQKKYWNTELLTWNRWWILAFHIANLWRCKKNKRQKSYGQIWKLLVWLIKLNLRWYIEEMQNKLLKIVVGLSGRNDPFECKCPSLLDPIRPRISLDNITLFLITSAFCDLFYVCFTFHVYSDTFPHISFRPF